MKQIYICSDTIKGIFSAIYDAWKQIEECQEQGIALHGEVEHQLFSEYLEVVETEKKSAAVEKLIKNHLGGQAYQDLYHALLSTDLMKGSAVLGMMKAARTIPNSRKIMDHLGHPDVRKVFELSRNVKNEAHRFIGFVRFKELRNGVLFSEIAPKSQILTCIADHFTDRLPTQNFMIYDKTHQVFLVHQARHQWVLVQGEQLNRESVLAISETQKDFERLWQGFLNSISIKERESSTRQRQNVPLWYRQDMVEF